VQHGVDKLRRRDIYGAPGGRHNDHLRRAAAGVHGEALLRLVPDEARGHPLLPCHPPLRHGLRRSDVQQLLAGSS
jgi:hypothetical protein